MSYRERSLKLMEMPFLRQKLGFTNLDGERVTDCIDFGYTNKVLVGNWFENRSKDFISSEWDVNTTYMVDYKKRSADRDITSTWKNRLQGQRSIELKQGRDDEYLNNKATVYDLAYRCKVRDFVTGNYGNVTGTGKKECKQQYWSTQRDYRRVRYHTEYRDAYSFEQCFTHIVS